MNRKNKKSIFLIIAVILFALIGGISTAVYSSAESKVVISLNDDKKWECKKQFDDKWYVNTSKNSDGTLKELTFNVDLRRYLESLKDSQSKDIAPFTVSVSKLDNGDNSTTDLTSSSNIAISKEEDKEGVFYVKFTAPIDLNDNDKIVVDVNFDKKNNWGIEPQIQEFNLIADNTTPILNVTNLASIERKDFKDPVSLICNVSESNLYKVNIDINKTEYDGAAVENIHREILWDDKDAANHDYISFSDNPNEFYVNFNDDGHYAVYITLVDKAGNTNENSNYKIEFQKNAFEFEIEAAGAESNNNNYLITKNNSLQFTFTKWEGVDLNSTYYKLQYENSDLTTEYFNKPSKEITFPCDGTYTLDLMVCKWNAFNPDKREEQNVKYTIIVDTKAPEITATANGSKIELNHNEEYYFNENQIIEMNIEDSNLISSNLEVYRDGELVTSGSNSLSFSADEEGLYEIHAYANDIANNEVSNTYKVYIDKKLPEINVQGVKDNEKIKKGDDETRTVKITAFDENLKEAEAVITRKSKGEEDDVQKISLNSGEPFEYIVDRNGIYSISVRAVDKAGNAPEDINMNFQRDADAPKMIVKADGRELVDDEFSQDDMTYIKNENGIKIEALVEEDYPVLDNSGDIKEASYIKVNRTPVNEYGEDEQTEEGSEEYFTSEKTVELNKDGKYEVTIYSVDSCGNESKRSLFFILDGTAPQLSVTGIEDFYSGSPEIVIESNDAFQEGGVISIVYKKTIKQLDGNDEESNEVTKCIDIDSPHKIIKLSDFDEFNDEAGYTISEIKAVDKVGNESRQENIKYTVDKNPPVRSIDGLEDGKLYYNTDRTITVNTEDVNLDKDSVKFTITKNGEKYEPTAEEVVQQFTVEDRKAYGVYTFASDGEYKVILESKDKSGNGENEVLEKEFIIDKTLPVISIDDYSALNGSYINYDKALTVRINDLNLESDINLTYVNIVKKYPDGTVKDKNYEFNLNGESPDYSDIYNEFTEDAEYTVTVKAEDKAGNIATSDILIFTVDKTVPVQSITGVDNDAYYNVDKDVEISSIDVNQNINTLTVTRDGEPYSIGEFTLEGFKAYLNYTFSSEGTYEITFTTTDKANNSSVMTIKFTIDKTAPDIKAIKGDDGSELKFGEYINRIFTPQFVLDNSEDFITQVTLNGADVTGNVAMASQEMEYNYTVTAQDKAGNSTTIDTSFTVDTTNPAISISGIMSGFFNKDLTPEFDITDTNLDYANTSSTLNGEPFTSGTTIDTQDDFNLKLVGTDLATNSNSQSISFTIDKDGPVISFKNPISGKYFTEDFIPEFLINDLSDYTIIALTLDGEEYHIGDVIDEEGKHVLYIEVMDKAGNVSELSVEFILDKTAPKFLIDGVEDGETYYDATSADITLDNPLDKINSIVVNGEAADGDVSDEYGQQVVKLNFNDINDYEVILNATDEAGNTTIQTLNFTVAEKTLLSKITTNKKLLYSSIAAVSAVLALGITRFVFKRRKRVNILSEDTNSEE